MSNLTDDEVDLLSPFIWGGWIGVAKGKEAAFSRDLRATVERIVAARERAARAEALREAGLAALSDGQGVPFDHDYDRAIVGAWLDERADREEADQ